MTLYWQSAQLIELAKTRSRLPHALLVHGREGMGQLELASAFAQALLCEQPRPDGGSCGACPACVWFGQGNHPDFRLIQPESMADDEEAETTESKKKSDQIRIEQVRELQRFLSVGTHRAGRRVILMHPADTMNPATQNAVLKSLEEPPPDTVFLLVTGFSHRLLPTIRSRCQNVVVTAPSREQAAGWLRDQGLENPESLLALAGGAPLTALRLAESEPARRRLIEQLKDRGFDPVAAADSCLAVEPSEAVGWIQRWVYDLMSFRLAGAIRYHVTDEPGIRTVSGRCLPAQAGRLLRRLAQARGLAQHPLNPRLFFEGLLLDYQGLILGTDR